MPVYERNENMF